MIQIYRVKDVAVDIENNHILLDMVDYQNSTEHEFWSAEWKTSIDEDLEVLRNRLTYTEFKNAYKTEGYLDLLGRVLGTYYKLETDETQCMRRVEYNTVPCDESDGMSIKVETLVAYLTGDYSVDGVRELEEWYNRHPVK